MKSMKPKIVTVGNVIYRFGWTRNGYEVTENNTVIFRSWNKGAAEQLFDSITK